MTLYSHWASEYHSAVDWKGLIIPVPVNIDLEGFLEYAIQKLHHITKWVTSESTLDDLFLYIFITPEELNNGTWHEFLSNPYENVN